jgi:hypothetical protein
MIHNTTAGSWHPVIYGESPLPGPPAAGKPIRHKSKGHHTKGFRTREEALQNIESELVPQVKAVACGVEPELALHQADDIRWDGTGIPATVAFFVTVGTETRRAL